MLQFVQAINIGILLDRAVLAVHLTIIGIMASVFVSLIACQIVCLDTHIISIQISASVNALSIRSGMVLLVDVNLVAMRYLLEYVFMAVRVHMCSLMEYVLVLQILNMSMELVGLLSVAQAQHGMLS